MGVQILIGIFRESSAHVVTCGFRNPLEIVVDVVVLGLIVASLLIRPGLVMLRSQRPLVGPWESVYRVLIGADQIVVHHHLIPPPLSHHPWGVRHSSRTAHAFVLASAPDLQLGCQLLFPAMVRSLFAKLRLRL